MLTLGEAGEGYQELICNFSVNLKLFQNKKLFLKKSEVNNVSYFSKGKWIKTPKLSRLSEIYADCA